MCYGRTKLPPTMRLELCSAAHFLVHLVRLGSGGHLSESQLERFRTAVIEVLRQRYREHWFPDKPCKGSGYRCIRMNGKIDPVIAMAGEVSGLPNDHLHTVFPSELTMWIDPKEVSYRIGENGSVCVLYEEGQDGELVTSGDGFGLNNLTPSPLPFPEAEYNYPPSPSSILSLSSSPMSSGSFEVDNNLLESLLLPCRGVSRLSESFGLSSGPGVHRGISDHRRHQSQHSYPIEHHLATYVSS